MKIKETALKLGEQIYGTKFYAGYPSGNRLIDFAEALVAELVKENKPVCAACGSQSLDLKPSCCICADCGSNRFKVENRYTIPPTAEQIEQSVAEAIAHWIRCGDHHGVITSDDVLASKWREYL